jgi:DNA-binding XRE family transcriptional regulator
MLHRWAESWLERFVEIEAPRDLITLYDDRTRGKQAASPAVAYQQQESLGERLKTFRLNNNITALKAAELIGIDNGTLSKIESGKMQPGPKVSGRISAWLSDMKSHPAKRAAMHETKQIE